MVFNLSLSDSYSWIEIHSTTQGDNTIASETIFWTGEIEFVVHYGYEKNFFHYQKTNLVIGLFHDCHPLLEELQALQNVFAGVVKRNRLVVVVFWLLSYRLVQNYHHKVNGSPLLVVRHRCLRMRMLRVTNRPSVAKVQKRALC